MAEGIIFDLDGTLLDSMGIWLNAGAAFLRTLGVEAEEGLAEKLMPLSVTKSAQYLKERYGLNFSAEEIIKGIYGTLEQEYFNYIPLKEGAEELLKALHGTGIPAAIATATDRYLVEAALSRLKIDRYISAIFTCREVGAGKREGADVYVAACNAVGARRSECWVFEDAPHAARTAKAAGFKVAGVRDSSGIVNPEVLRSLCDIYFESLSPAEKVLSALQIFPKI